VRHHQRSPTTEARPENNKRGVRATTRTGTFRMSLKRLTVVAVVAAACMFQLPAYAMPPVADSLPAPVPDLVPATPPLAKVSAVRELPPLNHVEATDLLLTLAVSLRDIRYRFGGHDPSTGFDCSGFVRYVFRHALGVSLPHNSRRQFSAGTTVERKALRPGDLVFFRTAGKHISHVGIYLDDGRFIHAPSRGEHVRVDSLDESYWANRYAGARRPDSIASS
jgi:cell wall-associated NlpC family hydrolase